MPCVGGRREEKRSEGPRVEWKKTGEGATHSIGKWKPLHSPVINRRNYKIERHLQKRGLEKSDSDRGTTNRKEFRCIFVGNVEETEDEEVFLLQLGQLLDISSQQEGGGWDEWRKKEAGEQSIQNIYYIWFQELWRWGERSTPNPKPEWYERNYDKRAIERAREFCTNLPHNILLVLRQISFHPRLPSPSRFTNNKFT